jgi:hypothetical protein
LAARKEKMANKSVWMIEKQINGEPHWWIHKPGQDEFWDLPHRWTTDPNTARHYDSRAAAEWVIGYKYHKIQMVGCVATEHVWMENEDAPQEIKEDSAHLTTEQSTPCVGCKKFESCTYSLAKPSTCAYRE